MIKIMIKNENLIIKQISKNNIKNNSKIMKIMAIMVAQVFIYQVADWCTIDTAEFLTTCRKHLFAC